MATARKVAVTPRTFGVDDTRPADLLRQAGYELVFNPYGRLLTDDEMAELIADADGVIVGLDPLGEKVLKRAHRLKAISKYGVGLDNISIDHATRMGILVTNTPGTNSWAVAELTMGLLLDVARSITLCDRKIRRGMWGKEQGFELRGKTLGLVGTGQIGKDVGLLAKGFGMSILCYDIKPDLGWARSVEAEYVSLTELLERADVVSIHLPLNDATAYLISKDQLALMKPSAVLINTARGGIVDERALYRALKEKRIAGAGLDVFEREPPDDSPLRELDNVVLTSHIGSHTREAVSAMGMAAAQNLIDALTGKTPPTLINPAALKQKSS